MGPMDLHFDFRDIFRAPRLALSGKKIWIFMTGNLAGFVAYWVLTYLALALAGLPLGDMVEKYGLYPCLFGNSAPWFAWGIYFLGSAAWVVAILLSCTAVSRVTLKQLKGNDFFSGGDAWAYVHKHWHPVVFTSVTIALIIVFFLAFAALFGLICKIPYLGPFLYALPYPLYIIGSIFTVYTGIVLVISLEYASAIVGTYEEDTMGTVFQSYAITWSQPWRIIVYNIILWPLAYVAITLFSWFCHAGVGLMNLVFGFIMGESLNNIFSFSTSIVFPDTIVSCVTCCLSMVDLSYLLPNVSSMSASLSIVETLAGIILSLFLFLIALSVLSYGCSVIAVGRTLEFIIYKQKSDDDNLLERKDEDELEEEDDDFNFDDDDEDDGDEDTDIVTDDSEE